MPNLPATVPPVVPMTFGEMEKLADSIARSRLFGIATKEQAIVLMCVAQAEGRHPVLAARDYDIIQGRPAKKAEAMLRDFIEAGGKVVWHELNDKLADATFSHPGGGKLRISWDIPRAQQAGLARKENWRQYPRQMLRNRVVSEGIRSVFPAATSGMYEIEEERDIDRRPPLQIAPGVEPEVVEEAVPPPPPDPSAPIGEERVTEIKQLADEANIDDEALGRLLKAVNATTISEISAGHYARVVKTLRGRIQRNKEDEERMQEHADADDATGEN